MKRFDRLIDAAWFGFFHWSYLTTDSAGWKSLYVVAMLIFGVEVARLMFKDE